jgi:hypothetical protein
LTAMCPPPVWSLRSVTASSRRNGCAASRARRAEGGGGGGAAGGRSAAWRKARLSVVVGAARGKTTPKKELSLRSAAGRGLLVEVRGMVQEGVNVDSKNKLGWSAHAYAVRNGHSQVAKLLESAGCEVSDVPQLSAIEKAVAKPYRALLRAVIREVGEPGGNAGGACSASASDASDASDA